MSKMQSYVFTDRKLNPMIPSGQHSVDLTSSDEQTHNISSSTLSNAEYVILQHHIKSESPVVHSTILSMSSTTMPACSPYGGEFGFEIAFEQQSKDTKSVTWTYSESLKKLYVRMSSTCPIRFRTSGRLPPQDAVIRATPVYVKPEHVQEIVTRCPNHATTREFNENHPAPSHLVRCEHKLSRYVQDGLSGRQSVIIPHEQPQAGAEWVTNLYQFMCFSSCVGGLGRRPVQVIFTLEVGQHVHGRQAVEVRICACPGRDRKTDEEMNMQTNSERTFGQKAPHHPPRSVHQKGQISTWHNSPTSKRCKTSDSLDCDDSDNELFTLTIHGRENYDLLYQVNEALKLSNLVPVHQRELYLKQRSDDDEDGVSNVPFTSDVNPRPLTSSTATHPRSTGLQQINQTMTVNGGLYSHEKHLSKSTHKPSSHLY